MPKTYLSLTLAAVLALGTPAFAQEADAPKSDVDLGTEVAQDGNALGTTYDAEKSGDWTVRCLRTDAEQDPCEMSQMLNDQEGNAVAEVSLFKLPDGQAAVAGATVATPLETLLTEQLMISVDGGAAKKYPFRFCTAQGCFAQIGFTAAELEGFKKGSAANIVIVPRVAPDQKVVLEMSLSGFTKAFDTIPAR